MTHQSQSPLGIVLALALTAACWLPTVGMPTIAPAPAGERLVVATTSPLVLM